MTNMPELEFIQISIPEEAIVAITLNRPPVNAFNPQMYHEVKLAFEYANAPENRYRCIILNAKGKMFSAGNDISIFSMMQYIKIPIIRRLWMKQVMQCYSLKFRWYVL